MPVAAANYPYPGAPSAPTPQGAPTRPPEDYLNVQARPEAFGEQVGHSMSALGGVLAKSANEFAQLTLERQDLHNKVTSDAQTNNYLDATNKILYGDPNDPTKPGYYALRGEAAVRAFPATRDALMQAREQMRGALENDYQRMQFDADTRRQQSYLMGQVGRHYDQQYDVHQNATSDAQYALGKGSAAANIDDPNGFALGVQKMMTAAIDKVKQNGGGQEQIDAALAKVRADATVMRIDGVTDKNPGGAMSLLNDPENKALILAQSPTEYLRLERSIKSSLVQRGARDITASVMGDGDLWARVKAQEAGVGSGGEALVSPAGAVGVSQILPKTAQKVAGDLGLPYDEKRLHTDQAYNETLGREYLRQQLERYNGNEMLAAAAYNAGPDRVDEWIKQFGDPRTGAISPADFTAKIPIKETRDYVGKVAPHSAFQGPDATPKTLAQLEADASAQVNAYAKQNGLDDDMTEQLMGQTLSRVRGRYNLSEAATKEAQHNDWTLAQAEAIAGGPNGDPFRSMDEYLADPERKARYDRLSQAQQLTLANRIAKADVPATLERVERFSELRGMAIASPAEFLKIDPVKEDLPRSMQKALISLHDQVYKQSRVDFDTNKAMTTLTNLGYFENTGIDKKNNPQLYHQFVGALSDAGREFKEQNKKPPDTDDLRKIATDLLKVVVPGSWYNPFSSDTRQFETMVPRGDRDDIVRAYNTQYGRNPTPNQILRIYHYQLEHPSAGPNQATAEQPTEAAIPPP